MAVKKTKTIKPTIQSAFVPPQQVETKPEAVVTGKKNYFVSIPMKEYGGVFLLALVLISFVQSVVLGYLWTKIRILELQNTNVEKVAQAPTNNQAPVQQPQSADNVPKITSEDKIRGNKNARIALIEYSDTECPFCKTYHPTLKQVLDTYKNDVQWVYRHFPLSFHQNAQKEAEAAECVFSLSNGDTFWKYLDAIYERTTSNGLGFDLNKLAPTAQEFGVNAQKFQQCLDSGKYSQKVADQMSGGTVAGINGTPGTVLLDTKTGVTRLISGAVPFEELKKTIEELLKS